jgi:hypothetical protein
MGCPDLGDVDDELRMLAHDRPGRARMVEVDVREEEVPQVTYLVAAGRQCSAQRREAARRSAVDERQPIVRVDEVRADATRVTTVQEIERLRFQGHGGTLSRVIRTPVDHRRV